MKKILIISFLVLTSSLFTFCEAQYTKLLDFNYTNGAEPGGPLTLSGKTLYGMTFWGGGVGGYGCIFSIDTDGNNYKDLHNFNDTDGRWPQGDGLTLFNGVLYGMTSAGGVYDKGCIFSMDTNGANYKDIFDFDSTKGTYPVASLTLSGGALYGMTTSGGAYDNGCVFKIDTNGSGYRVIHSFMGSDGGYPLSSLTLSGVTLYGMTAHGGVYNVGCIFSMDTNGTQYRDLFDFNDTAGGTPESSLILSGRMLYGTTAFGGKYAGGNLFSIDTNGTQYKDLFDFNGKSGNWPQGSLVLSGGLLYGTNSDSAGHTYGDIYFIDTNGSRYTDIFNFNDTNGANPENSLVLSGNVLYGMTTYGGVRNAGVIFRIDTSNRTNSIENLTNLKGAVTAYPNPSTGVFTLSCHSEGNEESVSTIKVYNELGQQVFTNNYQITKSSNYQIDLSNQPNGVYLYRVITESGSLVGDGKLVIER